MAAEAVGRSTRKSSLQEERDLLLAELWEAKEVEDTILPEFFQHSNTSIPLYEIKAFKTTDGVARCYYTFGCFAFPALAN